MSEFLPSINVPVSRIRLKSGIPMHGNNKNLRLEMKANLPRTNNNHNRYASLIENNFQFDKLLTTTNSNAPKHSKKLSVADLNRRSLLDDSFYQDLIDKYCKSPKRSPKKTPINRKLNSVVPFKPTEITNSLNIKSRAIEDLREKAYFNKAMSDVFISEIIRPQSKSSQTHLGSATQHHIINCVNTNNTTNKKQSDIRLQARRNEEIKFDSYQGPSSPISESKDRKKESKSKSKVVGLGYVNNRQAENLSQIDRMIEFNEIRPKFKSKKKIAEIKQNQAHISSLKKESSTANKINEELDHKETFLSGKKKSHFCCF